jgi:hypothetical protein
MPGRTTSRVAAATFTLLLVAISASAASASSPVRFGAKLTTNTQPSNSSPAWDCEPNAGQSCTRVMTEAYGRGTPKAPKDGTIVKIRLIAGEAGSLTVFIAKVKDDIKAKVVRKGPTLHFNGQPEDGLDYTIEKFPVNIHVNKGEVLAFKSTTTSVLRCNGGGNHQLIFQPRLVVGDPYQQADETDGCYMLIEAQYAP